MLCLLDYQICNLFQQCAKNTTNNISCCFCAYVTDNVIVSCCKCFFCNRCIFACFAFQSIVYYAGCHALCSFCSQLFNLLLFFFSCFFFSFTLSFFFLLDSLQSCSFSFFFSFQSCSFFFFGFFGSFFCSLFSFFSSFFCFF